LVVADLVVAGVLEQSQRQVVPQAPQVLRVTQVRLRHLVHWHSSILVPAVLVVVLADSPRQVLDKRAPTVSTGLRLAQGAAAGS